MASVKVVDVIDQAAYMLTDENAVRWPKATLLSWFNEAQRALVARRPDSLSVNETFTCAAGPKQTLPALGIRLLGVLRNVAGGRSITHVSRATLASHIPDWYGEAEASVIDHYVYDERDPKVFYLYPPAQVGTEIEIQYTTSPAEVVIADFVTDTQVIDVDDIWANALQEYILYGAWSKDSETAGNQNRALSHYQQFLNAIGDKSQADAVAAPRTNRDDI